MTPPTIGERVLPAPIECETAVRRLWDYLDGRLSADAHREVEAHLATCAGCPSHFRFARRIQTALPWSSAPRTGDAADERLRQRVLAALRATGVDDRPRTEIEGEGDPPGR
jgi:anti-sigma factor RsiW